MLNIARPVCCRPPLPLAGEGWGGGTCCEVYMLERLYHVQLCCVGTAVKDSTTVNLVPSHRDRKMFFEVCRLVMVIGPLGVSNEMPSAAAANSLAASDF